ncbi:serine/arginine repetitive matrix protein 1-like, partial [Schistocerca americana]|uniref:serine/arginine repetitive matrix protein 1-like n=1 Tax=Schistocerca americana TaxID=7009 RepID=UPI001F50419C
MNRIGDDEEPGPHPRVASPRSSRPEQTHRAEIELASRTTQGARQRHPTPPAPTPEDLCTAMIQEKLEQLRRDRDARATELAKRRDQDGPTTSDNSSSDDCRTKTQIPTEQHHAMDHHEESSDSDAPFQEVRRRRKGTKRRKAEENTRMQTESRAVPTTNYYAPLQKQDEPTADQHQLQPNDTTSQHTPAPPPPKPRIPPDRHRAGEIVRTSRTCRMNRIGDDEEPGPHPRVASPRSSRPEQTHRAEIELASRTTQGARQRHPTPPAPTPEDLCTAMIQEKLEQLRRDRDARATELAKRRDQDGPTTSDNSSSDDCRTKTQIPTEQHHAMDHHEESSDSDAPFQEVRRRRKGTKRRKAEENTRMQTESRAVPTTNYYAPLQKQDEPTADQHQLQPNDTTSQHTPAPPPPKPRIPP